MKRNRALLEDISEELGELETLSQGVQDELPRKMEAKKAKLEQLETLKAAIAEADDEIAQSEAAIAGLEATSGCCAWRRC